MGHQSIFDAVRLTIGGCLLMLALAGGSGCAPESLTDAEYVTRAKELETKGQLREAILELKNALRVNPSNAEARWLLGKAYLEVGNAAGAEKELERALSFGFDTALVVVPLSRSYLLQGEYDKLTGMVSPLEANSGKPRAQVLTARAEAYRKTGRRDKSRDAYERALEEYPNYVPALTGLAGLALDEGDMAAAESLFRQTKETAPDDPSVWVLGGDLEMGRRHLGAAEKAYRKALELQTDSVPARKGLAWALLSQNKLQEVDRVARGFTGHDRSLPSVRLLLGSIAYQREQYDKAERHLTKVVEFWPSHGPALLLLAGATYAQGKSEQAERLVRRVLSRAPRNASAHALMGAIYLERGQVREATALLRKGVDQAPGDSRLLAMLGAALIKTTDYDSATMALEEAARAGSDAMAIKAGLAAASLKEGDVGKSLATLAASTSPEAGQPPAQVKAITESLKRKDIDTALRLARELLAIDPDNPKLLNVLAVVYVTAGEQAKARETLEQVLALAPGDPSASHNLALLELAGNNPDRARSLYQEAVKRHPEDLTTMMRLAELETRQGDLEAAKQWLDQAIERHPQALDPRLELARYYVRKGQPRKALLVAREIPPAYLENASVLALIGETQMATDDPQSAIATFQELVRVRPGSPDALFLLGKAYDQAGDAVKAQEAFDRALAMYPNHFSIGMAKARSLMKNGKLERAHDQLEQLKSAFPGNAEVVGLQGALAMQRKRYREAEQAFSKAVALAPSSKLVQSLADAQWRAGNRTASLATLEAWIEAHPRDLRVQYLLANSYQLLGREADARRTYEAIIGYAPNQALALNNLAWLLRGDDPQRAWEYAKRALELAPEAPNVLVTAGRVSSRRGDTETALRHLRAAADKRPGDKTTGYYLALTLTDAGETDEAVKVLEAMLADGVSFPQEGDARGLLQRLTTP